MCAGGRDSPYGSTGYVDTGFTCVSGHIRGTGSGIPAAENQTGAMNPADTFRTVPTPAECRDLRQKLDDIHVRRITVPMLDESTARALDRAESECRWRLKYARMMGVTL